MAKRNHLLIFCLALRFGFCRGANDDACELCPAGEQVPFFAKNIQLGPELFSQQQQQQQQLGSDLTCGTLEYFVSTLSSSNETCSIIQQEQISKQCFCSQNALSHTISEKRLVILVWFPRISAILSFLCSSSIVFDILKGKKYTGSTHVYHQIMLGMSLFDSISSFASALAILPMPREHSGFAGSQGTNGTCKAQGFFLELGDTSIFYNMSLSIYYLLVIYFGWKDYQLKKAKIWFHALPLVTGLVLALAAIPYYGPQLIWCHIKAKTYSNTTMYYAIFELIPLMLCTVVATLSMIAIYCKVSRRLKASSRWSMTDNHRKVEREVARQAFLYLIGFYLSWAFFLCASTANFTNYWAIVMVHVTSPSQGIFNYLVYRITRRKQDKRKRRSSVVRIPQQQQQQQQQQPEATSLNGVAVSESKKYFELLCQLPRKIGTFFSQQPQLLVPDRTKQQQQQDHDNNHVGEHIATPNSSNTNRDVYERSSAREIADILDEIPSVASELAEIQENKQIIAIKQNEAKAMMEQQESGSKHDEEAATGTKKRTDMQEEGELCLVANDDKCVLLHPQFDEEIGHKEIT